MEKSIDKKRRVKKKKPEMGKADLRIFISVLLLVGIGFMMVYSASSYYSLYNTKNEDPATFLKKQLIFVPLGIIMMLFTMSIDYHKWKKITVPAWFLVLGLLIFVLVGPEKFAPDINGATRWIRLGGLSLQPSELAKYSMVLLIAMLMEKRKDKMRNFFTGPVFYLGIACIFSFLILKENNLSIATVVMIVTGIMIFVGGMEMKQVIGVGIAGFTGVVGLIITSPYRLKRLTSFFDPWSDASNDGYQLIHSLYAIASGGILGSGLGQSKQKALFMPEPHNDFIFSILAEEFGLAGCLLVIALFLILIISSLSVAVRAKDSYGRYVAVGITSVVAVQAIINIAVVTGSMPVTGVPLPFISYGGTSLVFTLAAMGIVLNISRQAKAK